MAIQGKNNVIEMARSYNAPYWKIYESAQKRITGNFVAISDFDNANLALETSLDKLRSDLNRLTPGQYIFVAFKNNSSTKGMMDTIIEIEDNHGNVAISGISATPEFYLEGIGKVTPENFEVAIEQKMKKMREQEKREDEEKRLRDENAELKKQITENEAGFNKGVMTIGTIAYGMMSQTPQGKEFIGMAKQAMFTANKAVPGIVTTPATDAEQPAEEISGTNEENRLEHAVTKLSNGNPDWLKQLEKLADLKEKDPATFEMAVGSLDSL